jgi:hypothetical protein
MSTIASGKSAHDTAVAVAEGVRQAAVVPGATQATVRAAEIAFYKSVLTSALANNNGAGTGAAITALISLQGTAS